MALGDIIPLALFHAKLDEGGKFFYHPCAMSFFPALMFIWKIYSQPIDQPDILAKLDGDILGFAFVRDDELGIVLDSKYRNLGIGHKLMECLIGVKPKLWLRVNYSNLNAIKLYLDCGFKITGQEFDSRGRNLLRMERN
jgi:GNAT superfamily N-acetyltransferase